MSTYNSKIQNIGKGIINIWKSAKNVGSRFSFWAGVSMVLLILIATFYIPCPSVFQFHFFRIIIALGLATLAASLPKFFQITPSNSIKIGTGFAVFIVVYFFNPASIVIKDDCNSRKTLRGKVIYGSIPLSRVEVNAAQLSETDITNGAGEFDIEYSGELDLPLNIHFRYRNIDTLLTLKEFGDDEVLNIYLKDTVPPLTRALVSDLIGEYLKKRQQELEVMHRGYLTQFKGRKVDYSEVCRLYKYHEDQCDSQSNGVFFENGFERLLTQKAMRNADFRIDPFNPYGAYYLDNFEAYLYEIDSSGTLGKNSCRIHFALLNRNKPVFELIALSSMGYNKYRGRVSFKENVRYVRTSAGFHSQQAKTLSPKHASSGEDLKTIHSGAKYIKAPGGKKSQKTYYFGTRPFEEFIIAYRNRRWQIIGTA